LLFPSSSLLSSLQLSSLFFFFSAAAHCSICQVLYSGVRCLQWTLSSVQVELLG
jgi:hypothetical protein